MGVTLNLSAKLSVDIFLGKGCICQILKEISKKSAANALNFANSTRQKGEREGGLFILV